MEETQDVDEREKIVKKAKKGWISSKNYAMMITKLIAVHHCVQPVGDHYEQTVIRGLRERRVSKMQQEEAMYVTLECPNTIFYIYIRNERECSKLEIFMNNIRFIGQLKVKDIYDWCNHQKIAYKTQFKYNKRIPVWRNMGAYYTYFKQKNRNQPGVQPV